MNAQAAALSDGEALYCLCCMVLPFLLAILVIFFKPGGALLFEKIYIALSDLFRARKVKR